MQNLMHVYTSFNMCTLIHMHTYMDTRNMETYRKHTPQYMQMQVTWMTVEILKVWEKYQPNRWWL